MKKVYVYHEGEMVEKHKVPRAAVHDIMPDLPDFVSTIDGRIIKGRRGLRDHNKEHGVTNPADYKEYWAKHQTQRERLFSGQHDDPKRKQAIIQAFNKLQDRRR